MNRSRGRRHFFIVVFLWISCVCLFYGFSEKEVTVFTDSKWGVEIMYPKAWFSKTTTRGDTYQLFLTKEELKGSDSAFQTGVGLLVLSNAKKAFAAVATTDKEIAETWVSAYESGLGASQAKVSWDRKNELEEINGVTFYRTELRVDYPEEASGKHDVGMILIFAIHKDRVYNFTFESPLAQYESGKSEFNKMIASLKLF